MPLSQLYVGPQLIPVEEAGNDAAISDPTIDGLLAYFGFWIKAALDTKLAEMGGPTAAGPVADACPVAHRFPWNHQGSFAQKHDVGGGDMQVPLPGLWMWSGESESDPDSSTILYDAHKRNVTLQWIFPEVQVPNGFRARAGLTAAVERALRAAVSQGYHRDYENGQPIGPLLSIVRIRIERVSHEAATPVPRKTVRGGNSQDATVVRFFPSVTATLSVSERVSEWQPDPITDSLGDINVTIAEQDLDVLERVLIDPEDLA